MSTSLIQDIRQGVGRTLNKAASATGAGFDYLFKTAMRESGLNPSAKARSSSAAGMFQFIEQTWLATVKKSGHDYGLGNYADKITRTSSGFYQVANAADRKEILDLRYDADVAAMMAGAFTNQNSEYLQRHMGRTPTDGELYIAHFMGAQGARNLLTLAQNQPEARAADFFPAAAAANRSIFYSRGAARSVSQVYAQLIAKHDNSPASTTVAAAARTPVNTPFLAQAYFNQPSAAMSYASPASSGPVFHSMFSTERQAPVSTYVSQMWSGLNAQSSLVTSPATNSPLGSSRLPLNLFSGVGT
jgi:hypothetical protein